MIEKLLLTITVVDLQQLDKKEKPVMYIRVFVEIYNQRYRKLVYETHGMVEFEKYPISRVESPLNLGGQQLYKISKVLPIAHVMLRDTETNTSYLNNYINQDEFN